MRYFYDRVLSALFLNTINNLNLFTMFDLKVEGNFEGVG